MKLIDMLVEEGLSGWRWPEGYYSVAQDKNDTYGGNIYAYINALSLGDYWSEDNDSGFGLLLFKGYEVAEDAATSLVTREQYEAALAAKNGGWIEWGGGECPVEKGTLVDVKYRDGDIYQNKPALGDRNIRWSHVGSRNDIIAYRLHQPNKADLVRAAAWNAYAGITKADDETDLNELASQDVAPVWNGEGLPPAGCKCEYLDRNNGWYPVTIKYASNQIVVICGMTNILVDKQETEIAKDVQLDKPQFRPILSEAERKREEARKAIYAAMNIIDGDIADAIYDAIADGKIPGVKLEGL